MGDGQRSRTVVQNFYYSSYTQIHSALITKPMSATNCYNCYRMSFVATWLLQRSYGGRALLRSVTRGGTCVPRYNCYGDSVRLRTQFRVS
jgi:hypothetical protein